MSTDPLVAPLVAVERVCHAFGEVEVLHEVSLAIAPGEIVTLIGPNGAGKTTLVHIVLGLLRPDRGELRRRPGLVTGYVPQRFRTDPAMPIKVRRFLSLARGASPARLALAAADTGIEALLESPLHGLSGGQLQRVLLARCLIASPDLLVLDEPDRGLDVGGQVELYDLIGRLRQERGVGVLLVSHDLHLVMAATTRVICLNRHVCCAGHPETVSEHPEYLALFGPAAARRLAVYAHRHDHQHGLGGEVAGATPFHRHGADDPGADDHGHRHD
jgi:zinc transport system ATP-binding protein